MPTPARKNAAAAFGTFAVHLLPGATLIDYWWNDEGTLSEDPLRADEENLYRYVGNDPATLVDASGLQSTTLADRTTKLRLTRPPRDYLWGEGLMEGFVCCASKLINTVQEVASACPEETECFVFDTCENFCYSACPVLSFPLRPMAARSVRAQYERTWQNWCNTGNHNYSLPQRLYTTCGTHFADFLGPTNLSIAGSGVDPVTLEEYGPLGRTYYGALGTVEIVTCAVPVAKFTTCCAPRFATTSAGAGTFSIDSTALINPRLIQRLEAFRCYRAGGGAKNLQQWVRATQGNPAYGTGFRSGYARWIRSIESIHGNSKLCPRTTTLYRLEDTSGNLLKRGITNDPNTRYTREFLMDKNLLRQCSGSRAEMLRLERELVETQPGPLNCEPWAGRRAN